MQNQIIGVFSKITQQEISEEIQVALDLKMNGFIAKSC